MSIGWDKRNKRWRYHFDRYIEGQRKRTSRLLPRGWTQAQADAYERKESGRLYAVASGVVEPDPLIETGVALYIRDKSELKSYRPTLEHLNAIAWAFVGKPMSALPQVAATIMKERGDLALGTIRNRLAVLKAACRWAWKMHGLTQHDPTSRMQLPNPRNERHVYLDRRQMLTLAWATHSHAAKILMRTAFYTALRKGEIARVVVDGDMLHLDDTKNGDRRSIPAHPKIRTCLPYLPLEMPKATLHKYLKAARKATKITGNTFHDLRHSSASEMVNAGVDLFTVGAVLGHKDPRSTKRYAHHTARTLSVAIGTIGRKSPHNEKPKAA